MEIGTGIAFCGAVAGLLLAVSRFVPSNKVNKDVCKERHKGIDDKLTEIKESIGKIFDILNSRDK